MYADHLRLARIKLQFVVTIEFNQKLVLIYKTLILNCNK